MEYKFVNKTDTCERSKFANKVCQLLVDSHNKDIVAALKEIGPIYDHFQNHVRNIYELIDSEIPLFALYDLARYGKDNWNFNKEEYRDNKIITMRACARYYRVSMPSILEWEENNI
jgi:hypothetical protein